MKARFQSRPVSGVQNIDNLMVKWINDDAVIADENGEAQIFVPASAPDSDLTIWVKGQRTIAVSKAVGAVGDGDVIDVRTLPGGDANGDNAVDMNDFNILSDNYGKNGGRLSAGF